MRPNGSKCFNAPLVESLLAPAAFARELRVCGFIPGSSRSTSRIRRVVGVLNRSLSRKAREPPIYWT